ncbi:protein-glutamate O-methyltransferase CheR [bacterium]|nr:protein-glutamate O-methyltransferase CheR [bacterium]
MKNLEEIEIRLLLEAIFQHFGNDFREYASPTINRRIRKFMDEQGVQRISDLIPLVLYDENISSNLIHNFSIPVTEMFRDPKIYLYFKNKVLPKLKSYPELKIWHAGCATGEEVYSVAIFLKEAGLLDRCIIYATDCNDVVLEKAKKGIFGIDQVKLWSKNYHKAGGEKTLSEYYHSKYDSIIFNQDLKQNIVFSNHNLTVDESFAEINLILCRNVLIYFNKDLQNKVFDLFDRSLPHYGYLWIGEKENLRFSTAFDHFEIMDEKSKIYRKLSV